MNKNYKIYCDDCLNVMSGMEDESVDLVVTDPPYKTITGGDSNGKNSVRPKWMWSGNRKLFAYQKIEISAWIPELFRILKKRLSLLYFHKCVKPDRYAERNKKSRISTPQSSCVGKE